METQDSLYGNLVAGGLVAVGGTFASAPLGFSSTIVLAASVYTLTLTDPIDLTDALIMTTLPGAGAAGVFGNAAPVQASDTSIAVSTFDVAGAAGDRSFYIGVFSRRASPNRQAGGIGRLVASAQVDATGALVGKRFGIAAAPVLAASVYTYTLIRPIDVTQSLVFANPIGSTASYANTVVTADATYAIATANQAGAATDMAHQMSVWRYK